MIKFLPFFIFFFHFSAKGFDVDRILARERIKVTKIDRIDSDRVTFISSDFAKAQIETIGLRSQISKLEITKVYYVYTAYKLSPDFDQLKLDKERFQKLLVNYPEIFRRENMDWEIIEQTGLTDFTEGESFFHGFILIHRPLRTDEVRQRELDYVFGFLDNPDTEIKEIITDPVADKFIKTDVKEVPVSTSGSTKSAVFKGGDQALSDHIQMNFETPNDVWKDRKDFWANYQVIVNEHGKVTQVIFDENYSHSTTREIERLMMKMPDWRPKIINGKAVTDTVKFELRVSYSPHVKGMFLLNGQPPRLSHSSKSAPGRRAGEMFDQERLKQAAVFKSLEEVKTNGKIAVIIDVTGSMHGNIVSTTYWLQNNQGRLPFSSYTAFNDGDKTKDKDKEIGNTGGIYFTSLFTEYNRTIKKAMLGGNGGDFPENDIEAILTALEKDQNATEVLLIADNMSEVKDIELLDNINKPVSVLLCSLTKTIHPHYLDLVYQTGGKIYYNGKTIDLSKVKKGDSFKLKKVTYAFNGNHFKTS